MNRKTAERIISTLKAYGDPGGWDTQTLVDAILAAAQEEPQAIPQAEIDALPVGRAYGGTEPKPQASAEQIRVTEGGE